jgi:hypothetical protein
VRREKKPDFTDQTRCGTGEESRASNVQVRRSNGSVWNLKNGDEPEFTDQTRCGTREESRVSTLAANKRRLVGSVLEFEVLEHCGRWFGPVRRGHESKVELSMGRLVGLLLMPPPPIIR